MFAFVRTVTTNNHKIIGWRAWFIDAPQNKILRFSSKDTEFKNLPKDGMQGLVLYEGGLRPDGYHKHICWTNYDYYFQGQGLKDLFYGCEVEVRERNMPDEIAKRYPDSIIIRGMFTDMETLAELQKEMWDTEWQP